MGKWGRPGQGKAIVKDITSRNYVRVGDLYFPPGTHEVLTFKPSKKKRNQTIKTGWTDDSRNIKNKEKYRDGFIRLVKIELGLDVWPEFYFSPERLYRLDYAIPDLKIGIEVNGGVWSKGNSGHSSGTGIMRDYEKSNLAQTLGWKILSVVPSQMDSLEIIALVRRLSK